MNSYKGWEIRGIGYHCEARKNGEILKARNKHEILKKIHDAEKANGIEKEIKDLQCCFCKKKFSVDDYLHGDILKSTTSTGQQIAICATCFHDNYFGRMK